MFLPISQKDMKERGIEVLDFIIVTGDAYVDHPTFGTAIISRVLEKEGYTVGIISQPNWKNDAEFKKLGVPRFGFMVNAGNIDSMVAHYTAAKRKRSTDAYSPGNKMGLRPDSICESGGTGRRARLRGVWATVRVQVPFLAPKSKDGQMTVFLIFKRLKMGLEAGAVLNDSPGDCQIRVRTELRRARPSPVSRTNKKVSFVY